VVAQHFTLNISGAYLDTYLTKTFTYPSSPRARSHLFSNMYTLAKTKTIIL